MAGSTINRDSLGVGVTCVTELHDDGLGRDYVYQLDGRDVCAVSTRMRQLDLYEATGLSWLDTLRLSRCLIHAAERLSQIEFAARAAQGSPVAPRQEARTQDISRSTISEPSGRTLHHATCRGATGRP